MFKYDYTNFLKVISKHSRSAIIVSFIGIAMVAFGLGLGLVFGSVTPSPSPVKFVPYTVQNFNFTKDDYPGIDIPPNIHANYKKELRCMARNLYFESRDQPLQGRIAVGLVTLNRVVSNNFPNSVCEVVWQKRWSKRYVKWVAQFSWTLDGKSDHPIEKEAYKESERLASALLAGGIDDFTKGADHYHADWMEKYPAWAKKLTLVAQIEDHIFYQEPIRK